MADIWSPNNPGIAGFNELTSTELAVVQQIGALADPNANRLFGWDDTDNAYKYFTLGTGLSYDHTTHTLSVSSSSGASAALDNLASVAINTSLLLGTSDGGALGSVSKMWSDLFLALGAVINFNNGDVTLTHSADTLTLAGGILALPSSGFSVNGVTVTTTGTQLNYINAAGGTTGTTSTNLVFSTSPTLVTPTLGAATATTINGNTFTAGTYTLTGQAGKTLTFNGSITLTGTDAQTYTFPTTSATIARTDAANAFTGHQTIEGVTTTGATGTGKLVFDTAPQISTIELGAASDTTISRVSAGVIAVEGATVAMLSTAQTWTAQNKFNNLIDVNNAIAASSNAATVPITFRLNTVTNSSAATLTITMTTTSAVDGQMTIVRILDFSAAAQTITWVNTENSTVSAPTTSNGSTTLFLTVGFIYNSGTTKWRCIASA